MPAFAYWAYGLCLTSDEPLGGLAPAPPNAAPDVSIQLHDGRDHEVDHLQDPTDWRVILLQPLFTAWVTPSAVGPAFRLRFGTKTKHVDLTISESGSLVRARRSGGCTIADVEAIVLGPGLTCALRARGFTCLHASVVAIDGAAVAVLGEAGAGKSTTAAGLLRLGARALADDLAVVVEKEGLFLVHRGGRRLRLHPDAAAVLGGGKDLPRVWPDLPSRPARRYLEVPSEIEYSSLPAPVPLASLYVLTNRDPGIQGVVIEPISSGQALAALLSNASASFMLPELGPSPEFARLAKLASKVPMRRVRRPDSIGRLEEVCRSILDDALGLVSV